MEAAQKAVDAVTRLSQDLGVPQKLSEVGITEADITRFANYLAEVGLPGLRKISFRDDLNQDDLIEIYKAAL